MFQVWLFFYDWQKSAISLLTKLYYDWFRDIMLAQLPKIAREIRIVLNKTRNQKPLTLRHTPPVALESSKGTTHRKFVWDLCR